MKVEIVPERGDALIATAARASFNRRADQYTDDQNEGFAALSSATYATALCAVLPCSPNAAT